MVPRIPSLRPVLVPAGRVLFRYRNGIFPGLLAVLLLAGPPPADTFGSEALEHVKDACAVLVALAGLTLRAVVIGQQHVRRAGVNRTIHADTLFTGGIFGLCRNPLYTGNLLIFAGIFLMHGAWAVILGGSLVFGLVYRALVAAEEDYLGQTFGATFTEYVARVPRWIPDLRRLPAALASRPFLLRRVFIVEYTNIGLTVLALAAVEFGEEVFEPLGRWTSPSALVPAAIALLALVFIGVMRTLKKTRVLVTPR